MELGAFSISLNVADLDVSRAFYERLGFEVTGGDPEHNYLILKNGPAVIGLFHGMFEGNILTFNPGLSAELGQIPIDTDVRQVREILVEQRVELTQDVEPDNTEGPGHIAFLDPDGNAILIDQFF